MSKVDVDIKKLLEAGAHFGHKTSRWHPKMASYIHSKRGGSHIIDLTKTMEHLETSLAFITDTVAAGKQILLVSTKVQGRNPMRKVADATNMPFVTERWLGGMLTNQNTIGGRIKHLKDLEDRLASGELGAKYSKLEVQRFSEEIEEMNFMYGGIKNMDAKVGVMFVIDIVHDINAVREAKKLGIPVVGLVDTNADPTLVNYPIACNDDATKSITLVLDYLQQAILAGIAKRKAPPAELPKEPATVPTPKPEAELTEEKADAKEDKEPEQQEAKE